MHLCLKLLCAKAFCAQCLFCARDFSLTVRASWRAKQLRWVDASFEEMRKVDQCLDEMKTVEKNLLRWHVRRDRMRWEELRWGAKRWEEVIRAQMRWDEMRWSAGCEVHVWRKCSLGVALRRGRAQVMFLDNNSATGSHKARTHGPGNFRPASCGHYW